MPAAPVKKTFFFESACSTTRCCPSDSEDGFCFFFSRFELSQGVAVEDDDDEDDDDEDDDDEDDDDEDDDDDAAALFMFSTLLQ